MDPVISTELLRRIAGAANGSPHAEVCGLLLGRAEAIDAVEPCRNVATDPARTFEIDPAALIAAHRRARAGGPRILGCYHSHPDGTAEPSARDAADAAPDGSLWLIAAGDTVTAWRATLTGERHGRFDPVALSCTPDTASPQERAQPRGTRMPVSPVDFASLLCSRLCHDLLSPVGALNNGLELLADETDPKMRERCMELLADSARASANKLKFFRLAFGAAGGFGEQVDAREARSAIEGLFADSKRLEIGWLVEGATVPKPAAKVLLNLAMIAGDALVRGGQLDIGGEENDGQFEIVVRAEGPRLLLDPDIRATLTEGESGDGVTPRVAAAYLVHSLAGAVQVSEPADNVMLFGAALKAG